jgi:hypothetical protein
MLPDMMARISLVLGVAFAWSVASCDAPQTRRVRVPDRGTWLVVPSDDDDDDDDGDEVVIVTRADDDAARRKPVVYVRMIDWEPSPAVLELEESLRAKKAPAAASEQ